MVSLTTENIKTLFPPEVTCSRYILSSLPRDLQRKIASPTTALLKEHVLKPMTPAPLSQWALNPRP